MFELFHEVVSNVSKTILTYEKELDRPVIGVMPAYFPLELVEAAGGYPVQLWGNNLPIEKTDAYLQSYCCSVARSEMELELRGISHMVKAYAFTSLCDTLINLREVYRWVFSKPTLELSIPCKTVIKWYEVIARKYDVPLFIVDTPFLHDELTQDLIDYTVSQFKFYHYEQHATDHKR